MVDSRRPPRARVADHFEETIGLRVAALEAQQAVTATEAESVKQHFAELREFITFTVTTEVTQLREEFQRDLRRVEQRLNEHDQRFDRLEHRIDGLEQRMDQLDRKMDAHHEAIKLLLGDILSRLPPSPHAS